MLDGIIRKIKLKLYFGNIMDEYIIKKLVFEHTLANVDIMATMATKLIQEKPILYIEIQRIIK